MDATNNTRVKFPKNLVAYTNMESNDTKGASCLNPDPGRDGCASKLVSCQDILKVSTMNVRTLKDSNLSEEQVANFIKHEIDFIGIQCIDIA